ncbi:MAG: DUF4339 domain-containing protein [Planctomycetia bacterium]|nr:DUF4339 domain-containing protein [Planctomycetia bacterium]
MALASSWRLAVLYFWDCYNPGSSLNRMGIKFDCVHCGHTLHVKDFLAGKRGICPKCQGKVDIPEMSAAATDAQQEPGMASVELPLVDGHGVADAASTERAASQTVPAAGGHAAVGDPIAEAPQLHWYVLPPGSMTKYGPAAGEMMRTWINEGRVSPDSLVWREGWPQWRVASVAFPRLGAATGANQATAQVAGAPSAGGNRPAAKSDAKTDDKSAVMIPIVDEPVVRPTRDKGGRPQSATQRTQSKRNLLIAVAATLFVGLLLALIVVLVNQ